MTLEKIPYDFTVCKTDKISFEKREFMFTAVTDEEISLVCKTCDVPGNTSAREDGWSCLRITGVLDFSLIGILADISAVLTNHKIGIFVVSTYNTDYIFVKRENYNKAAAALSEKGYIIKNL